MTLHATWRTAGASHAVIFTPVVGAVIQTAVRLVMVGCDLLLVVPAQVNVRMPIVMAIAMYLNHLSAATWWHIHPQVRGLLSVQLRFLGKAVAMRQDMQIDRTRSSS